MKKFLSLLLALVMIISLVACSNDNGDDGENVAEVYKLGDYELEYKGAKLAPDDNGDFSVILAFGFTNNGETPACYGFNLSERAEQGGEFMLLAALNSIADEYYYKEAQPGETIDVIIGFNLNAVDYQGTLNYTDVAEITISEIYGNKSITLTVDPADTPFADSAVGAVGGSAESGSNAANTGYDGFGDFASILVPEDFEFKRDSWNEENPHFVTVKRSDFAYFDFHTFESEELMKSDYEYVKKTYTNEQVDVSANYNGIEWEGFQYSDGMGGYGFELYKVLGSYYLRVSSAGFAFDNDIAVAVLGSVVMADGSGADNSGVSGTGTGAGNGEAEVDWLNYWVGDWYGWWYMTDGTGEYEEIGSDIWDACASIEVYEDMTGCMYLWDDEGSSENLIAAIDLGFANPDDTEFGVMSCEGGQFLSDMLESGDWYVDPSQLAYDNIFDFTGEYEDEYGTFSYRVLLRPWGTIWDDLGEEYYPAYYYDWYMPLVEAGKDMPDYIA